MTPNDSAPVAKSKPSRRATSLLSAFAVVLAVGGIGYYWHKQHYKHFDVHEANRVYRSAWMNSTAMGEVVKAHGIKAVVNLCRPGEMGPTRAAEERKAVEAAGGKLYELPLPDTTDASDERFQPHIDLLKNPDNYPLLVHCQHGVNRTSRVLAMYEVLKHGGDGESAIRKMPRYGRRDYTDGEYEFARNFTSAFRSETQTASPDKKTIR